MQAVRLDLVIDAPVTKASHLQARHVQHKDTRRHDTRRKSLTAEAAVWIRNSRYLVVLHVSDQETKAASVCRLVHKPQRVIVIGESVDRVGVEHDLKQSRNWIVGHGVNANGVLSVRVASPGPGPDG